MHLLKKIISKGVVATNKELYHYYGEYNQKQRSMDGMLHHRKMRRWDWLNNPGMKRLNDSLNKLSKDFFEYDGDQIKIMPPPLASITDKHGNKPEYKPKPILLNGKSMTEYNRLFAEIMEEKCVIYYSKF